MHFTTFLKKHFDIEKIVGTSDSGNDCESLFILRESWINAEIKKSGIWTVGDIYSTLEHGKEYTESELREMIKKGKVTSKY
ncbi:cobalamin biosynthesis protein CbiX [Escherichia coli]|nr:cobalamin biosynthesis protein CbiX [Escherichia coli]